MFGSLILVPLLRTKACLILILQILAAAELLGESSLNHSQVSYLQTVQACGTSLVETVNHVLDFTKLSGNSRSGGVDHVIMPTRYALFLSFHSFPP